MKAIAYRTYGTPDVLHLEEVAIPTPAAHEIRIRVHAAAVSSADCTFRAGRDRMARMFTGLRRPKRPVLGTELAGVVEAIGDAVTRFAVGDAVYAATGDDLGAHAEYVCVPEAGAVAHKPRNVDFAEAAALAEGTLTALPFLRDTAGLRPGQRVLVNGASGSVGAAAVQLAKHLGAEVTAVCSTRNVALVRALGADHVIDYTQTDFTRAGETWDVIFDTVGKSSFGRAKRALKDGGVYLTTVLSARILLVGLWTRLFGRKRAKLSLTGLRKPAQKAADLEILRGLVEAGEVRPVIDRRFPLEEAAAAHRLVETGHKRGHAVLVMAA
ncbi:MAG: NAD(P)-dependent alcohol dehydrogenase [Deltaproteobacteria bacterium]|nr:MAG: NAD(P)-dependent alcohol dehydrogenase [Deltaproteobacteria bacterium]